MQKDINYTFKMLYVIAIIMIVDGHIGSFNYLDLNNFLRYQNYHIALFMFTSGYFLNLKRNYKEFFSLKITKLIVPLYLWNLIYGLLCWYLNNHQGFHLGNELNAYNLLIAPITDGHQYIYNMGSWFLIPLFFVQTISYIILQPMATKSIQTQKISAVIYFIFSLGLGAFAIAYGPQNEGARNLTLAILRTFYFLPAFAFGTLYRQILEKYDRIKTPLYLGLLLGIIAFLSYHHPDYDHIPSWLRYINEPFWIIYAIIFCTTLFWLRVSKILSPVIEQSRCLQYIANHTFDIMMHHFIGWIMIKAALQNCPNFNITAYKTDIWYNYYPIKEELIGWLYIAVTIAIALIIGFTSRFMNNKIRLMINKNSPHQGENTL